MRTGALLALAVLVAGCPPEKKEGAARVALHKRTGVSFELIPAAGQLPHCLVYTTSSTGVIRQLTMSRENTSYACPAGKPIGNHPYRVPLEEGAVKVQVLFSSQKVNAASVRPAAARPERPAGDHVDGPPPAGQRHHRDAHLHAGGRRGPRSRRRRRRRRRHRRRSYSK